MLEGVLGAVATAILAGAGWLIKKWLDGRTPTGKIEEARSLALLHKEMRDSGATLETIEQLKKSLLERRKQEEKYQDEILEVMKQDFQTQAEMNVHAGYLLELAEAKLRLAKQQYEAVLEPERASLFEAAQRAWARFVSAQAKFAASHVTGGTMYPLVYAGEKEELTVRRAAALRSALEQEKAMVDPR